MEEAEPGIVDASSQANVETGSSFISKINLRPISYATPLIHR